MDVRSHLLGSVGLTTIVLAALPALWAPAAASAYVLKPASGAGPVRWDGDEIAFRVKEGAGCGPTRAVMLDAATIAVEAWRGVARAPDLVIEAGRPPSPWGFDGENGIYVLCDWPFEDVLALTVATHEEDGRMLDADILVNGDKDWALLVEGGPASNHYDIASVLTHEIGHVLGLDESGTRAATMFATTMRGDTRQRTLAADDEAGLVALYGEVGGAEHLTYGCNAAGPMHANVAPFALALPLLVLAALGRRRRSLGRAPRPRGSDTVPTCATSL